MPTKTRKLTIDQNKFVEFIKGIIGRLKRFSAIEKVLEENGFREVNSGGYKSVFKRTNDEYCVKVWHTDWGWKEDSYKVPKLLENHFVHPIYKNKRYLIQKWVKGRFSDCGYTKPVKKLPDEILNSGYDIQDDNIKVDGNREVVIDFCYSDATC